MADDIILFGRTQQADQTPFDNSTNGFTAEEVQSAIEEARDTAPGKARASIMGLFNGTVGNNDWLGYSNLIDGDDVPIQIPWNCVLEEISFAFKGSSVDGDYELYKNGLGGGNIVYTEPFVNVNGRKIATPSLVLAAGDEIVGRWDDNGSNPSDMAIVMFFLLT